MDDPQVRAYFAFCDAQERLNSVLEDEAATPEALEAARREWNETHAAWLHITGMEDQGDDDVLVRRKQSGTT